jgi:membrane-associated phospholipid phosphatase
MSLAVAPDVDPPGPARSRLRPPGSGRSGRTPLWQEALTLVWLLWIYDMVNNLSPLRLHSALAHASSILHVERLLFLDPELPLNSWMGAHRTLGAVLSNFYDNAHFVVTLGLLGWLWLRHQQVYRPMRNTLVLSNLIGFAVFWLYPVAPPRMLPASGFVDLVAVTHTWGAWHGGALASHANELAAMPSLHMAWALWSGAAIWLIARRWPLRVLAVIYPLFTVFVVLATGNHFFLDVVAGALTAVAAGLAAWAWERRQRRRTPVAATAPVDAAPLDMV